MSIRRLAAAVAMLFFAGTGAAFAQDATPAASPEAGSLSLTSVTWELTQHQSAAGTSEKPDDPSLYTLTFDTDGTVAITAACNTGRANWSGTADAITITPGAMTLMACLNESMTASWLIDLNHAMSYTIDGNGMLTFSLPSGGSLTFQPSLLNTVWEWTGTADTAPQDPSRYTLEFLDSQSVAIGADCNRGRGIYSRNTTSLSISVQVLTRAQCLPGSLSETYVALLNKAQSIAFTGGGLAITLDSGDVLTFTPQELEPVATPAGN